MPNPPAEPFSLEHADDLERDPADLKRLVDHRRRIAVEHLRHGGAEHHVALARVVVAGGEHPAVGHRVVLDLHVVRRGADDVHIAVLVAVLDLKRLLHLGDDGLEQVRVAEQGLVVVGAEDGAVGDANAAERRLAGHDAEDVGAERGDAVVDRLLRAGAERHHGDDRADADDDAQHGEHRPERVGPDRLKRDRDGLAQQHVSGFRCLRGAGARSACCMPGTAPPPVIRFMRSFMSACDCTRLALGSSSTESLGSSPDRTSL